MQRVLIGYVLMYAALEGSARLASDLGQALVTPLAGAVGLVAAMLVVMLLHGQRSVPSALRALGFGCPGRVQLMVSVAVSVLLIACLPLVFRLAGADFVLPNNWIVLVLGIVLLNGIAEETIYRGYLFRRLREGRTFHSAVLIGIALHTLAHVPLIAAAGIAVGLAGIVVAALAFPAMAYLYERGSNTIWAPAVLHATVDLVIVPLSGPGASATTATTAVILCWLGLSVACCYVSLILVRWAWPLTKEAGSPATLFPASADPGRW